MIGKSNNVAGGYLGNKIGQTIFQILVDGVKP
jgi:hypothetical protein